MMSRPRVAPTIAHAAEHHDDEGSRVKAPRPAEDVGRRDERAGRTRERADAEGEHAVQRTLIP
jgi:hypothetical protein